MLSFEYKVILYKFLYMKYIGECIIFLLNSLCTSSKLSKSRLQIEKYCHKLLMITDDYN